MTSPTKMREPLRGVSHLTVWTWEDALSAARLANGEEVPDASPVARQLAEAATAWAGRRVVDDIADWLDAEHVPSGKSGPRVSDLGGCRRAVWYRDSPPAGYTPMPEQYREPATMGSVLHKAAEQAGKYLYPWRDYEREIDIPGLDRPGKIDCYDPILGEVQDVKTAGDWRWERFGEDGPGWADWGQAAIYGYALEQQGMPVRTLRIIAVRRENGDEEHFVRDYDPAFAAEVLDELITLATTLDLGITPPRDGSGPTGFPCRSCPARAHCWNLDAADAAGRSPESYTILGPEPDDPSIAWAAGEVHEANRARRDAERHAGDVKALLEGIAPGTYGDWVIKPASRSMPDHKGHAARLLELYVLPDGHRPPLEDVADSPRRLDRWTEVKPVRAAKRGRARKQADASDGEAPNPAQQVSA